jgi:FimV-like protein
MNLARAYSAAGNIEKARDVLQRAITENPQSAETQRAKAMLKELK